MGSYSLLISGSLGDGGMGAELLTIVAAAVVKVSSDEGDAMGALVDLTGVFVMGRGFLNTSPSLPNTPWRGGEARPLPVVTVFTDVILSAITTL